MLSPKHSCPAWFSLTVTSLPELLFFPPPQCIPETAWTVAHFWLTHKLMQITNSLLPLLLSVAGCVCCKNTARPMEIPLFYRRSYHTCLCPEVRNVIWSNAGQLNELLCSLCTQAPTPTPTPTSTCDKNLLLYWRLYNDRFRLFLMLQQLTMQTCPLCTKTTSYCLMQCCWPGRFLGVILA